MPLHLHWCHLAIDLVHPATCSRYHLLYSMMIHTQNSQLSTYELSTCDFDSLEQVTVFQERVPSPALEVLLVL
jgi:hypothetical protein